MEIMDYCIHLNISNAVEVCSMVYVLVKLVLADLLLLQQKNNLIAFKTSIMR